MKSKGIIKGLIIGLLAGICAYVFNEQWKIRRHGDRALNRSAAFQASEDIFDEDIASEFEEIQV